MDLMRSLGGSAFRTGNLTYGCCRAGVHRESFSVALCKGNHAIFCAGVQLYTRASGYPRTDGLLVPSAKVE
jgi:hypothetical protein